MGKIGYVGRNARVKYKSDLYELIAHEKTQENTILTVRTSSMIGLPFLSFIGSPAADEKWKKKNGEKTTNNKFFLWAKVRSRQGAICTVRWPLVENNNPNKYNTPTYLSC